MSEVASYTPVQSPKYFNRIVFLVYAFVLCLAMGHHELWGDELHSWNITKASTSYVQLLSNIRYEGHPPLWYSLMWIVSRFTHNLAYLQLLQYTLACSFVFLLVFYAPFPRLAKALLPFGYYFLFEYGTLSRNYAGALVLAFALCILLQSKKDKPLWLYYLLLFLLSNTHLLGALLAASLHLYYLLQRKEKGLSLSWLSLHLLAGMLILLPSLYCIFPPSDSEMNIDFWVSKWNRQQLTEIAEAPVKSFIPIPAWWQYHFWNTQFLVYLKKEQGLLKVSVYLLSLVLVLVASVLLRRNRKTLFLFLFNLLLTAMVAAIFPLNSERYVGFIFMAFILSCWLYLAEKPFVLWQKNILNLVLFLQLVAGGIALVKDMHHPFSNAYKVKELMAKVPPQEKMVTDYWCLNNLSAYADKPFYCIELNRELNYILWDQKMALAMKAATPYCNGLDRYFKTAGLHTVYLLSSNSPEKLATMEPALFKRYQVQLTDQRSDAIEQYSNLYLYRISSL